MIPRCESLGKVGRTSRRIFDSQETLRPLAVRTLAGLLLSLVAAGCATSGTAGAPAAAPVAAAGPADVYIAAAPAAAPPLTLPQFLGVDQCKQHTAEGFGALRQFVHRLFPALETAFPGAEGPPPVAPVSSPENLESPSPAVAAAAKIKQEEDQAQQKILALNYLASIGCGGCYPEVEDALLAAMDDCTEDVRFAAVKAVKEAAGQPCTFCKHGACCSPRIRARLTEMSTDQGDDCCPREPSARIRRLARIALTYCGPDISVPVPEIEGPPPPADWAVSRADRVFSSRPGHSTHVPSAVQTADVPPATRAESVPSASSITPAGHSIGEGDLEQRVTDPAGGRKAVTGPVSFPPESAQTEDPLEVSELVTEWYTTIDPTLPLARKKALLREFLAERFRQEAEQAALVAAASQEFEFRDELTLAMREDRTIVVPAARPARAIPSRGPVTDTATGPGTGTGIRTVAAVVETPRSVAPELHVSWEQMELESTSADHERDLAMMNEIWRRVNHRPPNPAITVDKSRLRIRTSGMVPIREVSNAQLQKTLRTAAVGSCSPVFVTRDRLFLIRVLDRRMTKSRESSD